MDAEINKIKGISTNKKRWEYIWEYYYLWIIGIIAAICFIIFAVHQYTTAIKDNWFYLTITNTYEKVGEGSALWDGYVEYTGYDTSEKNVVFNCESYFDYTKNVTGNTYFETFISHVDSGTLDAVTMVPDSLVALGQNGCLLDLDAPECASIKEKYGDRFIYCEPFDEDYGSDHVAVGIDISDSILITKYHIYADGCALGIGSKSEHIEAVEQFLDYVFEEE